MDPTSPEEEEEEWIGEGLEFEEALAEPESIESDPFYFVRANTATQGDLWHAARVGDLARVQFLLANEMADVNERDRWDSTALYYSCLAGHDEVAEALLESGASCSEFTFDGERCFYVALTHSIRQLLRAFAQRPPPLPPLGGAMRSICSLCEDTEAQLQPLVSGGDWADFIMTLDGAQIPLHRCILAARSPFLDHMLKTAWQPWGTQVREVRLQHPVHEKQPSALKSLLVWCYTERLEVGISNVHAVKKLAKNCGLKGLVRALKAEQRTLKYYFKTVRREEQPRRFILQPVALPREERLSFHLGHLLRRSEQLAHDLPDPSHPADDFSDVLLQVENRVFRCHRCILAARSDYFTALFKRAENFGEGDERASPAALPSSLSRIPIGDVSAKAMALVLRFIYTDKVGGEEDRLPGWLMRQIVEGTQEVYDAAERLLVFPLKKELAEALISKFETRPQLQGGLEGVCRLLLVADMYQVTLLREHCLHRLAARFHDLAKRTAPLHEQELFYQFLLEVAPEDGDLLDGSKVLGASKGDIVGSGLGGKGLGTLLQDLREAFLHDFGGAVGNERDRRAKQFDADLQTMATRAASFEPIH